MWRCRGSNPGPFTCKANALPLSYIPFTLSCVKFKIFNGHLDFSLPISATSYDADASAKMHYKFMLSCQNDAKK